MANQPGYRDPERAALHIGGHRPAPVPFFPYQRRVLAKPGNPPLHVRLHKLPPHPEGLRPEREASGPSGLVMLDVKHNEYYPHTLIVGYRDKRTREFATGVRVKRFSGFERPARMKLDRLEAATTWRDLAILPGNHFEALSGDRKGQYSIRINGQWRICFEWPDGMPGPTNVEIIDYH